MAAIVHPKLAAASFERAIRPLLTQHEVYGSAGVRFVAFHYPYLDVDLVWHVRQRDIRLRVDGTDYPYRPVSGFWIDSAGERLLPGAGLVPQGAGFHECDQRGKPGPWFCFKGWREYHDHQGHQDVNWSSIRYDRRYAVLQLIQQLQSDLNKTGVTQV